MPHGPFGTASTWTAAHLALASSSLIRILGGSAGSIGTAFQMLLDGKTPRQEQLPATMARGCFPRRHHRRRSLFQIFRPGLVPVLLSAGRAHAHLRALLPLPDFPREIQMHFVQRLHVCLPSGDRRYELREQRHPDGRSAVRPLFRLRPGMPDRVLAFGHYDGEHRFAWKIPASPVQCDKGLIQPIRRREANERMSRSIKRAPQHCHPEAAKRAEGPQMHFTLSARSMRNLQARGSSPASSGSE